MQPKQNNPNFHSDAINSVQGSQTAMSSFKVIHDTVKLSNQNSLNSTINHDQSNSEINRSIEASEYSLETATEIKHF